MDRRALKKVAVRLNGGAVRGSSANLARVMGVSQATVRAWLTDPEDETTYRRMTRGARRFLAVMVFLHGAGLLDDNLVAAIDKVDQLLNEGDARFEAALQALNAAIPNEKLEDDDDEE